MAKTPAAKGGRRIQASCATVHESRRRVSSQPKSGGKWRQASSSVQRRVPKAAGRGRGGG
jgi:hypothetical protein